MTVSFRLATFNLENFDVLRGRESEFERRIAVLRPILRGMAADVLCLQEVDAQKALPHGPRQFLALDRLLCETEYQSYHRAASVRPGSTTPADVHNLVILSRWPIREQKQLHHDIVAKWSWTPPGEGSSPPRPIEIEWDRPLLYAKIALPGDVALHVVNLHLRAPRGVPIPNDRKNVGCVSSRAWAEGQFLAAQRREGQALEVRLFVERLFDYEPNALIAICGDLNSEEHDTPARLLTGTPDEDCETMSRRALVPLGMRVEEAHRFTVVHAERRVLIDHILASHPLAASCTGVVILNEGLQDEVKAKEPVLGSLHAPVVASFALDVETVFNAEHVVTPKES
ncbi:endonuclease/exonuclease/phosphatase family protein (plasmid) [Methylocapsa polymorpha]|uniref:Endonuclease/exonuclease/phosphatase family protein n=1 Tax=Methylocapsa polymorpha TaxID=3080828 RepID=A0ABZ0HWC2_9HYPH|nr:endonuclease/exonuclease/phosphatase family protein [Methylocapsa sp. RX1]WOJ91602.1 endonuclease/exonuclease/phosphatase family protein [Methylocapsa sp. RX1]